MKPSKIIAIIILVLALIGIAFYVQKFEPKGSEVSNGNATTTSPETGPCTISVSATSTLYARPSKDSSVFGEFTPSDAYQFAGGKTIDGWVGFDPGVAQAPNVGPFRLRYLAPDSRVAFSGSCSALPTVPALPAKTCFTMAQSDITIYESKDVSSKLIATMHAGDYTKVISEDKTKSPDGSYFWVFVDTKIGNLGGTAQGWMKSTDANFNGEECRAFYQD